jgi:hypothetical protein
MRGLGSVLFVFAFVGSALPILADTVTAARYADPTSRYDHGVFGDTEEWGTLEIDTVTGKSQGIVQSRLMRKSTYSFRLPLDHVFEDIAPRVADLDGDGTAEVVVVETDVAKGAALAVYSEKGKRAETAHIGQTHRWLAPLGIGDLDGDGLPEIAYVDRPHLARELVIVQYRGRKLVEVARIKGLTNHRIGDKTIAGGIRNCGQGGEAILANADWSQVMAVQLTGRKLAARALAPYSARAMQRALACTL